MKILKFVFIATVLSIVSIRCSKVLDQPPKDSIAIQEFFKNSNDLKLALQDVYSILPSWTLYRDDQGSDNIVPNTLTDEMRGIRRTPTAKGSGGWDWSSLRKINWIIENGRKMEETPERNMYLGIASFFRAYFYFDKVRSFGDVPWFGKVIKAEDTTLLLKPRDDRRLIIDSVMADLDYSIKYGPTEKDLYSITKYTALILKAEVGLFEGTFRKYHGLRNYEDLLQESANAAKQLIESGTYSLYNVGGPSESYFNLFQLDNQDPTETILAHGYIKSDVPSNISYYLSSPTLGSFGYTQDFINGYLMADGSRFTDQPGYETEEFYQQFKNRDPRLDQTVQSPSYIVPGDTKPMEINFQTSTTGYRVIKALEPRNNWCSNCSFHDVILWRYGEALLIYSEALAELGTISQLDLDISVNLLRDRVNMPHLKLGEANANPDSYLVNLYRNVDKGRNEGIILEIRRERRIELASEGRRYWDLMRWKEGDIVNRVPFVGVYFSKLGSFDFRNNGTMDVYLYSPKNGGSASNAPSSVTSVVNIDNNPLRNHLTGELGGQKGNLYLVNDQQYFDTERDYLYPIPLQDLILNPHLDQNPGWDKP